MQKRLASLDALRGIAALLVVMYHLRQFGLFVHTPLIRNGYLAVDFFFVLSGFVISHRYWDELRAGGSALRFAAARLARLLPLHIAVMAFFLAIEVAQVAAISIGVAPESQTAFLMRPCALRDFLIPLFLVQSLGNHLPLIWNPPSWSLGAEIVAYGVFAMSIRRPVFLFAMGAIAAVVLAGAVELPLGKAGEHGLYRAICGFCLGHLASRAWWHGYALPLSCAAALLIGAVGLGHRIGLLPSALAFGAALPSFAQASAFPKIAAIEALGRWPFAIYISHYIAVWMVSTLIRYVPAANYGPLVAISALGLAIALGAAGHRYVERPWRNRLMMTKRVIRWCSS